MIARNMLFVFGALLFGFFFMNCSDDLLSNTKDAAPTYTLAANASPVSGGGVSRNPDKKAYETGTTVTLTAEPNSGYTFTGWTGVPSGVNALDPVITLVMSRDMSVIAYFDAIPAYAVTYDGNGNTGGTAPKDAKSPYSNRSEVTVLGQGSLVKDDHVFGGWNTESDGSGMSYAADAVFNITGSVTLYARWIHNANAVYSVTISGAGVGVSGSGKYAEGTVVQISAGTLSGQRFVNWTTTSNGVIFDDAASAKTSFVMPANDVAVTANFETAPEVSYTVTIMGPGIGASGSGDYFQGETVTISAGTPPEGQMFAGWTATGPGVTLADPKSATTAFIMPANAVIVTAKFEPYGADPYYLGYGYDVINSSYISQRDVKISVLNQRKMINDNITVSQEANMQEFEMYTGSSLSEFYSARNESLKLGLSASVPFKAVLFSGKYEQEFGVKVERNSVDKHSYARGRSHRYTRFEKIRDGNERPAILKDYLSDGFAADMRSGNEKTILDRYGSHVFIRYYKGGAIEFSYAYYGTQLRTSEELKSALSGSFSAKLASFNVSISGSYNKADSNAVNQLDSNSTFQSRAYGGEAVDITSPSAIQSNYGTWLNSIESKAEICGIGGFNDSFMPIWELVAAAGESALARRLETEFLARAEEQRVNLHTKKQERREYTGGGLKNTFTIDKGFPATVEVYALGGGGGGQGGHSSMAALGNTYSGIGGAGGGGAVAYMKLLVQQPVTCTLTVGAGGSGSEGHYSKWGDTWQSGLVASDGQNSSVIVAGITLTAAGGKGGGGWNQILTGGAGGAVGVKPASVLEWDSSPGKQGTGGNQDNCPISRGGNAGSISIGTETHFGGSARGVGGTSVCGNSPGSPGSDGHVIIVVTYD